MPYTVRRVREKHCVFKKSSDGSWSQLRGGCHDSEDEARAQIKAIGASSHEFNTEEALFNLPSIGLFEEGMADRALRGEVIEIIPRGDWYDHYGVERHITQDVIDEFTDNWKNRLTRGIRRSRLAVDVGHDERARGWYRTIVALPPPKGVGASFAWNKNGRRALEENEFAYFSPTVYWRLQDHISGETVENQIGGGALTNYPYFGEVTSLYQRQTLATDSNKGDLNMTEPFDQEAVVAQVSESVVQRLRSMFSGGQESPDGANGHSDDVEGFKAQLAEMKTSLESMRTEAATTQTTYQTEIADLNTELDTQRASARVERFMTIAGSRFEHLPVATSDLAEFLNWCEGVDDSDDKARYTLLVTLLNKADEQFHAQFTSLGIGGPAVLGTAAQTLAGKIEKYMEEHEGASYDDAQQAIIQANPELYAQYTQSFEGGA
jgi:hypothetical protein